MNKRENQILDDTLEILKRRLNPLKIILFGSRAKEKAKMSSDFDLAVQCDGVSEEQKRRAKEEVESISGLYGVDIVYLDEIENGFKKIIVNSGKVLYERRA